ncbi:FHA domain-containing protein [Allorhizobium taibaishanense]|uniref:Type VI secretion system protein ImpI n=1 Tax=Allorhizobium taibaishanense TaxID=887144 RepID=A0A1Q9AA08_9HYPH|nr:FHA domain-containing protein [Allorhizobium taibaishanense]MBB4010027.1 type VI secretion system protein ImpI [Allorhizobium taibaishanense]OLP51638.1 hypothetical protein BJF91_16535 [Allorhizobium taibaishanense]
MKLELRPQVANTVKGQSIWSLDYGRRTIGRSPNCDWQVADDQCRVSKLHCTIARDRDGYELSDQSANGTLVDGKLLLEGDKIRLRHGAVIDLRGHRFTVSIVGEPLPDSADADPAVPLSNETPTISSILADIAPNGTTARSLLGERQVEEPWKRPAQGDSHFSVSSIIGKAGPQKEKSISRNVDIGWSGPPQVDGLQPVLPENWLDDDADGSSMEHLAAPKTFVTIAPPLRRESQPAPQEPREPPAVDDFDAVFADRQEAAAARPAGISPADLQAERMGAALVRIEEALGDSMAAFDLPSDALPSLSVATGGGIADRLEAIAERQEALAALLQTMMQVAGRVFDPRLLEARVDAAMPVRLPFLAGRDYWAAYRQMFEAEGRILSFRDFMRRAATGETAPETAAEPAEQAPTEHVMGVEPSNET